MEISKINYRTYCHATEDNNKVLQALGFLACDDEIQTKFNKKLKNYRTLRTKGYHGNPIITYEVDLTRSHEIRAFWDGFVNKAPELLAQLMSEIERRMGDDCYFHMRFNKQKAYEQKLEFFCEIT